MDSSILNFSHLISSLSSHKLIINNKPFTGYFKIANSYKNHPVFLIRETTFYNCQFKNGYLEVMNRKYDLVNEQEIETATPMKPVVYLYPTQTQDIKVEINLLV